MNKRRYKWCLDRHKWSIYNSCTEGTSLALRLMVTWADEYSLGFDKTGGGGGGVKKGRKKGEKLTSDVERSWTNSVLDVASVHG